MTPQIDFYIVPEADVYAFLFRITEKIYRLGRKIYIHAQADDALKIDELLWQAEPTSFIPHQLIGESASPPPPVQIGFEVPDLTTYDVLINLAPEAPSFFHAFQRIIEIVPQDDRIKEYTRNHYRFYHQQGLSIQSHNLIEASEG